MLVCTADLTIQVWLNFYKLPAIKATLSALKNCSVMASTIPPELGEAIVEITSLEPPSTLPRGDGPKRHRCMFVKAWTGSSGEALGYTITGERGSYDDPSRISIQITADISPKTR